MTLHQGNVSETGTTMEICVQLCCGGTGKLKRGTLECEILDSDTAQQADLILRFQVVSRDLCIGMQDKSSLQVFTAKCGPLVQQEGPRFAES